MGALTGDRKMKGMRIAFVVLLCVIVAGSVYAEWEFLNGPEGGTIEKLFYASDGTVYAISGSAGIFYSMDDGASWYATSYTGPEPAVVSESPSGRMSWSIVSIQTCFIRTIIS